MLSMDSDPILTYNPSTFRRGWGGGWSQQVTANQLNPAFCVWIFAACVEKKKFNYQESHITSTTSPDCACFMITLLAKHTPVACLQCVLNSLSACCAALCVPTVSPQLANQRQCVRAQACSWSHDVMSCKSELWIWWSKWFFKKIIKYFTPQSKFPQLRSAILVLYWAHREMT